MNCRTCCVRREFLAIWSQARGAVADFGRYSLPRRTSRSEMNSWRATEKAGGTPALRERGRLVRLSLPHSLPRQEYHLPDRPVTHDTFSGQKRGIGERPKKRAGRPRSGSADVSSACRYLIPCRVRIKQSGEEYPSEVGTLDYHRSFKPGIWARSDSRHAELPGENASSNQNDLRKNTAVQPGAS